MCQGILTKEGHRSSPGARTQYNYTGNFEASSVLPMASSHRWTFRYYSDDSSNPQVWSEPSDHRELLVSGEEPQTFSFMVRCNRAQGGLDAVFYTKERARICFVDPGMVNVRGAMGHPFPLRYQSYDRYDIE